MVAHSWRHRLRQSANILGDCCMRQCQEWGIIAAAIGHLGHNASTDVVGWLWVVLYVGICRLSYQANGDTLPTRWQWATMSIFIGIGAVGAAASTCRKPPRYVQYKCVYVPYDGTFGASDQGQMLDVWQGEDSQIHHLIRQIHWFNISSNRKKSNHEKYFWIGISATILIHTNKK
jgi:hypothetical protein